MTKESSMLNSKLIFKENIRKLKGSMVDTLGSVPRVSRARVTSKGNDDEGVNRLNYCDQLLWQYDVLSPSQREKLQVLFHEGEPF